MRIAKHQIPGWDVEQLERFYVYTNPNHPEFCVRQNVVSGTAEVLKSTANEDVANPLQNAVKVENGFLGSDGKKALELAILCAENCFDSVAKTANVLVQTDLI